MSQIGRFIRDTTRTEMEINPKSSGNFLYNGRTVDPMLLLALGSIPAEQA